MTNGEAGERAMGHPTFVVMGVRREEEKTADPSAPLGGCDFFDFLAGKLRTASANKHRRGSFDYAQDRLFDSAL